MLKLGRCAFVVGCSLAVLICAAQVHADPMVVNGDFESDTSGFVVWPGYVGNGNPDQIFAWPGEGGRGINPIASANDNPAPFRDNGDNDSHVAFLQGTAFIEQVISGFTVGREYTLGLDFNSRNCCGDLPIGTVSLNGQEVASSADIFPPPGSVIPVGGTEPWYHADIDFTPDTADVTLRISAAPGAGGDATLVVDNITIVPEPSSALLMLIGLTALMSRRRRQPA